MRSLFTALLILLILLTFGFAIIKFGSLGDDDNWFNANLRKEFAKSIFLRNLLSLDNPGDAVSDYLADRAEKIIIEVDTGIGLSFERGVLETVRDRVSEITGKPAEVRLSSTIAEAADTLDQEEILSQQKRYRNSKPNAKAAVMYVLLVGRSAQNPEQIGSTLGAGGAVIFSDAINELSANKSDLQVSTLLHEFLHLLGIGHIEQKDCIMNEAVEVGDIRNRQVSIEFCREELEIINRQKANINN